MIEGDVILIAENIKDSQMLLTDVERDYSKIGLNMTLSKTKTKLFHKFI